MHVCGVVVLCVVLCCAVPHSHLCTFALTPPGAALLLLDKECLAALVQGREFNFDDCSQRLPKLKAEVESISKLVRRCAGGVQAWSPRCGVVQALALPTCLPD